MISKSDYIKIWPTEEIMGVTFEQVKKSHTKEEYDDFCKWMSGQTCALNDKNEAVIYSWDYIRWLKEGMKKEQNLETFD